MAFALPPFLPRFRFWVRLKSVFGCDGDHLTIASLFVCLGLGLSSTGLHLGFELTQWVTQYKLSQSVLIFRSTPQFTLGLRALALSSDVVILFGKFEHKREHGPMLGESGPETEIQYSQGPYLPQEQQAQTVGLFISLLSLIYLII